MVKSDIQVEIHKYLRKKTDCDDCGGKGITYELPHQPIDIGGVFFSVENLRKIPDQSNAVCVLSKDRLLLLFQSGQYQGVIRGITP